MTQFFVPANIQSSGLQRSGSGPNIVLINQTDRLLLGAPVTGYTNFRILLVGDEEVGQLGFTDSLQAEIATIKLTGTDFILTAPDGGAIYGAIGTTQVLRLLDTLEVLAGGHLTAPDVGLTVGYAHTSGTFIVPTVGNNSQWLGLYMSGGEMFLRADRMIPSLPGSVLNIICDGTLMVSYSAGNGGDHQGNPLKNIGAGVDADDAATVAQVEEKSSVDSIDVSSRPRIVVSDDPTTEFHAINRNYLEDNSVARRCNVTTFTATGLIPATTEVGLMGAGIQIVLTLPVATTVVGRRMTFKKVGAAGIMSIATQGTDFMDDLTQYNLVGAKTYVELIATDLGGGVGSWIILSGTGNGN